MSGADEAVRHLLERMIARLLSRTKLARAFAGYVAEDAPERAEAVPSRLERDLDDREVGVAEQRLGPLDAPSEQVAVRRHSECLLEGAREVRLGNAADARKASDWPFLVRGSVQSVLGAEQPTQQRGILGDRNYLVSLR